MFLGTAGRAHAREAEPTRVTAKIVAMSAIPDAKTSIYKDCLVLGKVRVIDGFEPLPQDVIVAFWGFQDRKPQEAAAYRAGDYLALELIPWQEADPELRQIRQADDTEDFDLDVFWAHSAAPLTGAERDQAVKQEQSLPAVAPKAAVVAEPSAPAS